MSGNISITGLTVTNDSKNWFLRVICTIYCHLLSKMTLYRKKWSILVTYLFEKLKLSSFEWYEFQKFLSSQFWEIAVLISKVCRFNAWFSWSKSTQLIIMPKVILYYFVLFSYSIYHVIFGMVTKFHQILLTEKKVKAICYNSIVWGCWGYYWNLPKIMKTPKLQYYSPKLLEMWL